MDIADRIQNLRKSRGISQEELADKIRVSRQAVSKWESKQSTPDIEKIILLSDYFETTTDYLLKGIEPVGEAAERRAFHCGGYCFKCNRVGFFCLYLVRAPDGLCSGGRAGHHAAGDGHIPGGAVYGHKGQGKGKTALSAAECVDPALYPPVLLLQYT